MALPDMYSNGMGEAQDEDANFDDSGSSPEDTVPATDARHATEAAARAKRIACVICRKRKLKCDGQRPACGTCSRLGHRCGYDEIRRKSGPKRGYVKELEARLKVIESQLKSKQHGSSPEAGLSMGGLDGARSGGRDLFATPISLSDPSSNMGVPDLMVTGTPETSFPWEMIGLGLEEALPPQDMIDELHKIYFEKLHYTMPMIHKYRFLAALSLAPHMRPPVCLRYAIWAMACSVTEKYFGYAEVFYQRARKYAESDEMRGYGESMVTLSHCQAWVLISFFEFKYLFFPRAWMSAGRSVRVAGMLGLNRLDSAGLEVKQALPPPRDWTDREERRRTFWMAYCCDKYASVGTGWPMSLEEADIYTNLPSSNEDFEKSREVTTGSLWDALTPDGARHVSSFGGVLILAYIFGKNLMHLHRSSDTDMPEDPTGEFWRRHYKLDTVLVNTSMYLPDHLRLPAGIRDPNVVAINMYIHSATICLHQSAILKAEKHQTGASIVRESTTRCFLAASELVSLTKLCSPFEIAYMNPFVAFCLYIAARVFCHSYMKHPGNESVRNSLNLLLSAMQAHRSKNMLTESFLVQLQVDLDAAGLEHPLHNRSTYRGGRGPEDLYRESNQCPPVFPRQSHTQPSFQELSESGSPPVVGSGVHSPRLFSGGAFNIPSRERQDSHHLNVSNAPPTVPSQAWTDSGSGCSPSASGDGSILTPPPSHTGLPGYSPSGDGDGSGNVAGQNGGISGTTPSSEKQYSLNANGQPVQFPSNHEAGEFYTSAEAFMTSLSRPEESQLELPTDWGLGGDMHGLHDVGWGPVLDSMSWDHGEMGDEMHQSMQ